MANISTLLQKIMDAVYGEEVRGSIHDALSAMNTESSNAMEYASTAQDSAQASAATASQKASEASESAQNAASSETSALSAAANAEQKAVEALTASQNAASSEASALSAAANAEQARAAAANSADYAAESAISAEQYSGNPPRPDATTKTWWIWDASQGEYVDSHIGSEIEGPRGLGIEDIRLTSGNHSPGTTDIYTVELTDGTTYNISVWNGRNGDGSATIPVASDTAPQMDGTASAGSSQAWSRADHVHPTDTSRAAASHTHVKADITDFPSTMDPTAHTHTKSEITDFPVTMPPSSHTHSAGDITSGTLNADRLPTVPLTKGGTGQTTAAKGLYALINGADALKAANISDTDYIGLDDVSAMAGKKVLVSELKKLTAPLSGTDSCPAASSWTLDSTTGLYYVTVSLAGVRATHKLHLTPTIDTSDTATGEAQQEAWDTHYYAESVAGGVKFYAKTAPTVAVTFTWEAVL